jgi:hypothetical protein
MPIALQSGQFDEGSVPRYATLSHTWLEPEDEVTFHDMAIGIQARESKQKPGLQRSCSPVNRRPRTGWSDRSNLLLLGNSKATYRVLRRSEIGD